MCGLSRSDAATLMDRVADRALTHEQGGQWPGYGPMFQDPQQQWMQMQQQGPPAFGPGMMGYPGGHPSYYSHQPWMQPPGQWGPYSSMPPGTRHQASSKPAM